MKSILRFLRWVLIVLVVLVLVAGGGGYLWLRGALPQTSGTIKVQGISAPVEILRDSDAIPHIRAGNEVDALFGLGYVHAQDRLWQMEFQRRIGNGRLSEIVGKSTLPIDTFLRTLGPARAAASGWTKIAPEQRRQIEAYVAGINSFISTHHGRELPVEFMILGFEPEPWRPEDVLVWGKMMAWNLGGNWETEILWAKLAAKLDAEQVAQLMPAYTVDGPLILPDGNTAAARTENQEPRTASAPNFTFHASRFTQYDDLLAINRSIQTTLGLGGEAIGSNNWVIGGARTTTGKPLLANDPHLGAQAPSIWYLAHISGGALDAIGATLPGVPGVIIGHNRRIAWGMTNTGPDVQDLYIERVNERNEAEYNGAWEPMRIIQEVIKVKGQADVTLQVRITRHGPLISDATEGTGEPLAMRWTALDEEDHTVEAFARLNTAGNWEEFTAALSKYKTPMQNFVYADVDGNIGYYAPGALPIRGQGDGTAPVPGWTDDYDWTGYVPFEQLPQAYNPPQGYIATANNKVMPDSYPHLLGTNWAAPYRAARIVELIEGKDKLTPDDIAAIQADVSSAQARWMLPYLLQAETSDDRARDAIAFLNGWDGTIRGDSAQAAVYEAWYHQIPAHLFTDELGDELWQSYSGNRNIIAIVLDGLPRGTNDRWCDDIRTQPAETCAVVLGAALTDGLAEMAKRQGSDDFRSWRWDRVHQTQFPHQPLDESSLKPIFSRSIPNGGDAFTVNVAPIRSSDLYNQRHIPSYREIIDLSDLNASRFMFAPGQSGYLLSSNYSNLIERWQRVEYLQMRFDKQVIDPAVTGRLVLEP